MGVIVYTNPVNLKYKTVFCSKATAFYLLCCLLTIIPPLLVAYRSEGKLNKIFEFVIYQEAKMRVLKGDMFHFYISRILEENWCISRTTWCSLRVRVSITIRNRFWESRLEHISWLQRIITRTSQSSNTEGIGNHHFLI